MDPTTEFRRHADECRRMATAAASLADRTEWKQLAERWQRCAELAEAENKAIMNARPSRRRLPRMAGRPKQAA